MCSPLFCSFEIKVRQYCHFCLWCPHEGYSYTVLFLDWASVCVWVCINEFVYSFWLFSRSQSYFHICFPTPVFHDQLFPCCLIIISQLQLPPSGHLEKKWLFCCHQVALGLPPQSLDTSDLTFLAWCPAKSNRCIQKREMLQWKRGEARSKDVRKE